MFEKSKMKKELESKKRLIEELEKRRYRSQAKLVEAILMHQDPNDDDVDYFNKFTDEIEATRSDIQQLQHKLENM